MNPVVSAIVPLLSVLLGAFLTYLLNVRARRRTSEEDAYQAAISAVAVAHASRNNLGYQGRPAHFTNTQYQELIDENERRLHETHIEKVGEAQIAIARLVPYNSTMAALYQSPRAISERPEPIIEQLTSGLRELQRTRRFRWGWPPIGR